MRRYLGVTTAVMFLVQCGFVMAEEVRLHGATTVIDRIINPHKAAVEKSTSLTLAVVGNATGRGLADLAEGKCDASLASEPLEIAVDAAKVAGKEVDASKLKLNLIAKDEIVFVTHKSNPVKKLSWQQIKDIHTGKITNWQEVGGKNMPIVVFTDALSGGTRAMIKQVVLEGQDYGPSAKPQASVKKVNDMVAVTEGGFGGLGKGFAESDKVNIVETKRLERPLAIVTMGEPSPKVGKVIAAFQAAARQ